MKNQLKLRPLQEQTLKVGDTVKLIDGSSLTALNYDEEVYIVFPYKKLTGTEERLKDIIAVVTDVEVEGLFCKGADNSIYKQDIELVAGTGIFYTNSSMVKLL